MPRTNKQPRKQLAAAVHRRRRQELSTNAAASDRQLLASFEHVTLQDIMMMSDDENCSSYNGKEDDDFVMVPVMSLLQDEHDNNMLVGIQRVVYESILQSYVPLADPIPVTTGSILGRNSSSTKHKNNNKHHIIDCGITHDNGGSCVSRKHLYVHHAGSSDGDHHAPPALVLSQFASVTASAYYLRRLDDDETLFHPFPSPGCTEFMNNNSSEEDDENTPFSFHVMEPSQTVRLEVDDIIAFPGGPNNKNNTDEGNDDDDTRRREFLFFQVVTIPK
jgi:hypothetical protein